MDESARAAPHPGLSTGLKVLVALAIVLALLTVAVVFFPWDLLRGPVNRYVSERIGRHFEITRRLDVKVGSTTRILADGIEIANPEWASDPLLLTAEGAEIELRLWPLLDSRIELPRVELHQPRLGLQMEPDGRRSWALGRDTRDPHNIPQIGALVLDRGSAHFIVTAHGADIQTTFEMNAEAPSTPGAASPSASTAASATSATTKPAASKAAPSRAAASKPASSSAAASKPTPSRSAVASSTELAGSTNLPLRFEAQGTWQKEAFAARGRTGNALFLSAPLSQPFPIDMEATAGHTSLHVVGSIESLSTLDGADAIFSLRGLDLSDLYQFIGVVLPATPRYAVRGELSKRGDVWQARRISGKLGNSDLSGDLSFDHGRPVPLLTGELRSKSLDFDDLAPLVGLPEHPRSAAAVPEVPGERRSPPGAQRTESARDPNRKVLPVTRLDAPRLKAMEADVRYEAARMTHVRPIPLERVSAHVQVSQGVLQLDPFTVGVAGGTMAGHIRIDGNKRPTASEAKLTARAVELNKLFPSVKLMKTGLGKIHGDIDLKGRGDNVAQMLGTSSGTVAVLMGRGEISNLLLEFAGLDGGEILKFMMSGDRTVPLRCGAAAFDVNRGLMSARALVLDTTDTVIYGSGQVSLANESLDLTLLPYPKDMSILSVRSPLRVTGAFAHPHFGPDKGALAGRAGLALALAAINPLLALAATVETGPGKDANCGPALKEAYSPNQAARIAMLSKPPNADKGAQMGGPAPAGPSGTAAADSRAATTGARRETPAQSAPAGKGKPYGP